MRTAAGFTLVEILVVIAILAVMASLLFPVLATVKDSARKTGCINNQKQLGFAFEAYSNDYKGTYPPSVLPKNENYNITWDVILQPWIQDSGVLKCPGDVVKRTFGAKKRSYSMNDQMAYWSKLTTGNAWTGKGVKAGSIENSSALVLLTEWHHKDNIIGVATCQARYEPPTLKTDFFHPDGPGNNFLFYDGHVKYYRYNEGNKYEYLLLAPPL